MEYFFSTHDFFGDVTHSYLDQIDHTIVTESDGLFFEELAIGSSINHQVELNLNEVQDGKTKLNQAIQFVLPTKPDSFLTVNSVASERKASSEVYFKATFQLSNKVTILEGSEPSYFEPIGGIAGFFTFLFILNTAMTSLCCRKKFEDEIVMNSIAVRFDVDETKKQYLA